MPSSLPFSAGSTSSSALAAPVVVGIIDSAAARARRRSLCGRSRMTLVVRVRVDRRHDAVHDAERLVQDLRDRREAVRRARRVRDDVVLRRVVLLVVDAEQSVTSGPFAGAEMITFFAPPSRCLRAPCRASVNLPVDSITMSTPSSFQGIFAGSFSAITLIAVAVDDDAAVRDRHRARERPCTESWLRRWASVSASVRSLTATISSVRRRARPRADERAPDAAEAVDPDPSHARDLYGPSPGTGRPRQLSSASASMRRSPARQRRLRQITERGQLRQRQLGVLEPQRGGPSASSGRRPAGSRRPIAASWRRVAATWRRSSRPRSSPAVRAPRRMRRPRPPPGGRRPRRRRCGRAGPRPCRGACVHGRVASCARAPQRDAVRAGEAGGDRRPPRGRVCGSRGAPGGAQRSRCRRPGTPRADRRRDSTGGRGCGAAARRARATPTRTPDLVHALAASRVAAAADVDALAARQPAPRCVRISHGAPRPRGQLDGAAGRAVPCRRSTSTCTSPRPRRW